MNTIKKSLLAATLALFGATAFAVPVSVSVTNLANLTETTSPPGIIVNGGTKLDWPSPVLYQKTETKTVDIADNSAVNVIYAYTFNGNLNNVCSYSFQVIGGNLSVTGTSLHMNYKCDSEVSDKTVKLTVSSTSSS